MSLTPEQLAGVERLCRELLRLEAKGSPGPWRQDRFGEDDEKCYYPVRAAYHAFRPLIQAMLESCGAVRECPKSEGEDTAARIVLDLKRMQHEWCDSKGGCIDCGPYRAIIARFAADPQIAAALKEGINK